VLTSTSRTSIDDVSNSRRLARARAVLNGPPVVVGNARFNRHGIALTSAFLVAALIARATTMGVPGPYHPKTWDPQVVEMVRFIEAETGKPFKHPVSTNFLDSASFDALPSLNASGVKWSNDEAKSYLRCFEGAYPGASDSEVGGCATIKRVSTPSTSAMFLRFVGVPIPIEAPPQSVADLLPPNAFGQLASNDIVGLYDNQNDILYVRGNSVAAVRNTVAHELVHAWQDQYGLLGGSAEGADSDTVTLGIVEGYAELVAARYLASTSVQERDVVNAAQDAFSEDWEIKEAAASAIRSPTQNATREAQLQLNTWPYTAGPTFLSSRDPKALAKLLKKPPASTWSLLRPTTPDGGRGVKVDKPSAQGAAYTPRGVTIGPLYWSVGIRSATGDEANANQFVDLWVGDRAVVYESDGRGVCMLDRIRFVNAQAAQTAAALLGEWERKQPHQATVAPRGGTEVDVEVCV
jgi:hypothetical protein